jgi:predicted esterase
LISDLIKRAVFYTALFLFMLNCITGCNTSPKQYLGELAQQSSINQQITINTNTFQLYGWARNNHTKNTNIYIEGDGQAWEDPWTISPDPSPPDPMAFRIALADPRTDSILYIARPCQYIMDKRCEIYDWTSARFGPKVLKAFDEALDQVKQKWQIKTFTLHAYSGGAIIALLLASQRSDVRSVVTFAPLLDPKEWVRYHQYSPLLDSLHPLNVSTLLRKLNQQHFIGQHDEIVPYATSQRYFDAIPLSHLNSVHLIPEYGHHSDWPAVWKSYILKLNKP